MAGKYEDLLKKFQDDIINKRKNTELSDEEMANATGGVGGANESTCPKCSTAMSRLGAEYGSCLWTCPKCGEESLTTDAETIEIIKAMEQAGYGSQIKYPKWWEQIKK